MQTVTYLLRCKDNRKKYLCYQKKPFPAYFISEVDEPLILNSESEALDRAAFWNLDNIDHVEVVKKLNQV